VYLTLLILININITKSKTHSNIKTHYFTKHIRKYNNITLKNCFNFASKLYIGIALCKNTKHKKWESQNIEIKEWANRFTLS
jgi:hypothetical protein